MAQPQPDQHTATKPRRRRGVPILADKIRELREELNLDVPTFATKVGISTQHMYNLENGWRDRTSVRTAHRIAAELKVGYKQIVAAA